MTTLAAAESPASPPAPEPCDCRELPLLAKDDECLALTGHHPRCPRAEVTFLYRNHARKVAARRAVPFGLTHSPDAWHPQPGWKLEAWDVDRSAVRSFLLADVLEWAREYDLPRVLDRLLRERRIDHSAVVRVLQSGEGTFGLEPPPAPAPGRVLCVDAAAVRAVLGKLPGFFPGADACLTSLLEVFGEWRARTREGPGCLEEDASVLQVIPYAYLASGGQVALFRRREGDGRLVGRLTLGIGGHVEEADWPPGSPDLDAAVMAAFRREVCEEVGAAADLVATSSSLGLIRTDDPVGRVHLGVAMMVDIAPRADGRPIAIACPDGSLEFLGWVDPAALAHGVIEAVDRARLESWSALLLERWIVPNP